MASVSLTFISCTLPAKLRHRRLLPAGNCKNGAMTEAAAFPAPVVLWSKPEEERAGKPLLVLLHGYGANEEDLLSLADLLPQDFAVASVRAPMVSGAGF